MTRHLQAALHKVKGVVIICNGEYASGQPVESWAAQKLAFAIVAPLTEGAADLIANQLRQAGAIVTVTSCHGMISGNLSSRAQRRIAGTLDDAAATALASVRFELPDANVAAAAGAVKKAKAEYEANRKKSGTTTYHKICQVCKKPFTSAWLRSSFCSDVCRRVSARAANRVRDARRRKKEQERRGA